MAILKRWNINSGTIGEKTAYKTILGEELCVGDTVEVIILGNVENLVVVKTDVLRKKDKAFIAGIESWCNDETGEVQNATISRIIKPHTSLHHGDILGVHNEIRVCAYEQVEIPLNEKTAKDLGIGIANEILDKAIKDLKESGKDYLGLQTLKYLMLLGS